jgi:hypothetical protein
MVDYGFFVVTLCEWIAEESGDKKLAKDIYEDLLVNNRNFATNGFAVINVMRYLGISFVMTNMNAKKGTDHFYQKALFENKELNVFFLNQWIPINREAFFNAGFEAGMVEKLFDMSNTNELGIKLIKYSNLAVLAEGYKMATGEKLEVAKFFNEEGIMKRMFKPILKNLS